MPCRSLFARGEAVQRNLQVIPDVRDSFFEWRVCADQQQIIPVFVGLILFWCFTFRFHSCKLMVTQNL